jgi:hypothetical protein
MINNNLFKFCWEYNIQITQTNYYKNIYKM